MLGSVDWEAKGQTPDMNDGDKGSGELRVVCGDSPPVFGATKAISMKNSVANYGVFHSCPLFYLFPLSSSRYLMT